jgi:hypothetical protein
MVDKNPSDGHADTRERDEWQREREKKREKTKERKIGTNSRLASSRPRTISDNTICVAPKKKGK